MTRFFRGALLALLLPAAALAQDFAACLPEKTVVYVSLDNMARTRARFEKSGFHSMWNAEELKPLRERIEAQLEGRPDGVPDPIKVVGLLQGQVCYALIPSGQNSYANVGLVDLKEKRREILDLIEKLKEEQEDETRETEEEFNGYSLVTVQTLVEGQEEPSSDFYATKDDFFAISDDLDVLKDILTRRASGERTGLAQAEAFQRVAAATGERADLRMFVSSALWMRELGAAAVMLPALGLDGVKGVGGQFTFRDEGVSMRMLVQNVGDPSGLVKMFGHNIEGLAPAKLLPPDVDPALAVAIDWQFVYRDAMRVLGMFNPAQKEQIEATIKAGEAEIGLKVYDDLLASLAPGTYYGLLPVPRDEKGELPIDKIQDENYVAQYIVFLQKLRNKETIERICSKLAAIEGSGYKESQYLGTTIWEGADEGDPVFAVVGEHLVMGLRLESVQTIVRRQGKELKSFRDSKAFKSAEAMMPAKRSMLVISDVGGSNGSFFWTGLRAGFESTAPEEARGLLPGPDFLAKFIGVSVFSLSLEEQGLLFNWFWEMHRPDDSAENAAENDAKGEEDK